MPANGPPAGRLPPSDSSPYPWSQKRLTFTVSHTNPFPRYGPAVNATASKDGCIYLMGGLINGSTVKGDLWMVGAGAGGGMTCYPVATTSEGPGPRVGHARLLVGNAFIVFGGDTKMDEGDHLDDTLYLLNTCKHLAAHSHTRSVSQILTDLCSDETMVTRPPCRPTTARSLRPHPQYPRQ